MPLHLLGKKSWNVFNHDNIERVRRDEVAARAREEEEERSMQEVDAERRIQILRGLRVDSPPAAPSTDHETRESNGGGRDRKRRKLAGEDDTERDIRFAREDAESAGAVALRKARVHAGTKKTSDTPLIDKDGHFNLFPVEGPRFQVQKNSEAEAETAKKKREFEDQYTMRFSNAAGFKQGLERPWYSSTRTEIEEGAKPVGKDVWGNTGMDRKERGKKRIEDEDPLLAMKRGVRGLREVENERQKWKQEREGEINELKDRRTKYIREESPGLEDFNLDARAEPGRHGDSRESGKGKSSSRHHRHRRERPRSRSRDRSKERHRRYHSERRSRHERHRNHRKTSTERLRFCSRSLRLSSSPPVAEDTTITHLRREREEREKKERTKAAALLSKVREGDQPAWVKGSRGRYSNQFTRT